jgi:hypothetical protein
MNQQSSYRAFRSDDNNNSITRKYAKNKILKNRANKKPKPKTEEWFKQQQHMFRDVNSNLNTCSETFHKQQQHMIRYLQWKIYVELTTYRNILTEFPALVEVDVKH